VLRDDEVAAGAWRVPWKIVVQENRTKTSKYVEFPQCYIRYLWVANMINIYMWNNVRGHIVPLFNEKQVQDQSQRMY
jgi:2-phosphoglycerate kinase